MADQIEIFEPVREAQAHQLVLKSTLVVACGIVLSAFILYFSLYKEEGASYVESYRIISSLRQAILYKAAAIYVTTSLFIFAGIVVISLLYSHRIAGPLYRLGMFACRIKDGDLSENVRLRQRDVLHPLAEDLNSIISTYGKTITEVEIKLREIKNILATEGTDDRSRREKLLMISEMADELNGILSKIRL